jgi:DNA-binding NtrC family response regulator
VTTILLVEDDADLRAALLQALRDDGYRVHLAHNGRDALALHRAAPVDLILTDLMMPVMSGTALIAALHADDDSTPVIAMSAVTSFDGLDPSLPRLAKPFDLDALLDAIARHVPHHG